MTAACDCDRSASKNGGQVTEPKVKAGAQARPGLGLIEGRRSSSPGIREDGSHAELCTDPSDLAALLLREDGPGLWSSELCVVGGPRALSGGGLGHTVFCFVGGRGVMQCDGIQNVTQVFSVVTHRLERC